MAQDNDEMQIIKEVQTTNRYILKRLNQVIDGQCTCSCHKAETSDDIERRMHQLLENDREREKELDDLRTQLHTLKSALEHVLQSQNLPDLHFGKEVPKLHVKGGVSLVEARDIYSYHVTLDHDNQEISPSGSTNNDSEITSESDNSSKVHDILTSKDKASKLNLQSTEDKTNHLETSNVACEKKEEDKRERSRVRFKDENEVFEVGESGGSQDSETIGAYSNKVSVQVINQSEKRLVNPLFWDMSASQEQLQGRMSGLQRLEGLFTIVCVDISHSMSRDDAWDQAGVFFKGFMEGIRESLTMHNVSEESIALVTFGHKTNVIKRLTKDFTSLETAFDGLSLGGPSPMFGGLLMSTAAAQSSAIAGVTGVNGIPVFTKLILITDGYPTDTYLVAGPDDITPSEQDQTYSKILEVMSKMEDQFDVFFVPVGKPNMEFFELMRTCSDGTIVTHNDGKKIGRRLRRTKKGDTKIVNEMRLQAGKRRSGISFPFAMTETNSDEEDIAEILESVDKREKKIIEAKYVETSSKDLPVIGTRVRRGPDWSYGDQDSGGPGTVIGHANDREGVWIEWDKNGNTNVYRYGRGQYDVLIVDDPRMPKPNGRLAVGCVVKPGPDWKQTTRNVKVTDMGVVIRMLGDEKVRVHWGYNTRGDFTHSLEGIFEVEFCPINVALEAAGYSITGSSPTYTTNPSQPIPPVPTRQVKNKNKNKNL